MTLSFLRRHDGVPFCNTRLPLPMAIGRRRHAGTAPAAHRPALPGARADAAGTGGQPPPPRPLLLPDPAGTRHPPHRVWAQMNQIAPLDGMTVLEISSFVAAPLGGMTLAQLGADVIRIDPVGGGADLRRWPLAPSGTSLYWTGLNKGKRSVTLNFHDAAGRRLLGDLLAASGPSGGIVLTNADQEWLAYPSLTRIRPDLIHLQIEGYRDGRPAVD